MISFFFIVGLSTDIVKPVSYDIQRKDEIKMVFVGDIMLDRGVEYRLKKLGEDYTYPFRNVKGYLGGFDLVFGNLESVISNQGRKMGSIYSFRSEPKSIDGLTYAGFNILSSANNHSFDYGGSALVDSVNRLREAGIVSVGAGRSEVYKPVIMEINNMKIGFLAYTLVGSHNWTASDDVFGVAWLGKGHKDEISQAKEDTDYLVVSLHFGDEYESQPSGQSREMARSIIDAGADLLIGHHPHVVQPLERYNGGHIAYSLGNFLFDQDFSEETMRGIALEVVLEDGTVSSVVPRFIQLDDSFQINLLESTQ